MIKDTHKFIMMLAFVSFALAILASGCMNDADTTKDIKNHLTTSPYMVLYMDWRQ